MIIWSTMEFLSNELNQYLQAKIGPRTTPYAIAHNLSSLQNGTDSGSTEHADVILSLINIEEDRISKNPENLVRASSGMVIKNPKVFLNLYILFAANNKSYDHALMRLSYIIQFFQYHNVFDPVSTPTLPAEIEKLIPDLVTLNFEQLNQLWGILGGKYLPSALYKFRLVSVDEGIPDAEGAFIREMEFKGIPIEPVSSNS